MRRDPDPRARQTGRVLARTLEKPREAVEVGHEASLPFAGERTPETALRIKHWQERQSDPDGRGRRHDPAGQLDRIAVGTPVRVVMKVVELADARETPLQHLEIGEGGDRLDVVRREAAEEAVHDLAPGPEAVGTGAAPFGEARHPALESVAMQVRNTRDGDPRNRPVAVGSGVPLDSRDQSALDPNSDVLGETGRQEGVAEQIGAGHRRSMAGAGAPINRAGR